MSGRYRTATAEHRGGEYTNWPSAYTSSFFAGNYTFNTAMKWPFVLLANSAAFTQTTVIVADYRQANLTGRWPPTYSGRSAGLVDAPRDVPNGLR